MHIKIGPYVDFDEDREISIQIDKYDTYSMDHTLSLIIHPMLVQMKSTKHGSPYVDPLDVPEHLRPTNKRDSSNHYVDNTHHERWDWVLDEMIWAFEQTAKGCYGEQFYHNTENLKIDYIELEDGNYKSVQSKVDDTKPGYYIDREGLASWEARKKNGFMLFGKYYSDLWD